MDWNYTENDGRISDENIEKLNSAEEYHIWMQNEKLGYRTVFDNYQRKEDAELESVPEEERYSAMQTEQDYRDKGYVFLRQFDENAEKNFKNMTSDEIRNSYEQMLLATDEYINNKYSSSGNESQEGKKNLERFRKKLEEDKSRQEEYVRKMNSDIIIAESGKTYGEATLEEKLKYNEYLRENETAGLKDPAQVETEYINSEMKKIDGMELVGKSSEMNPDGRNKNYSYASDYILGRYNDNVNRGVQADLYDLNRVQNYEESMEYLADNPGFQKKIREDGLQETKETWPEVEKESDRIREEKRDEVESYAERHKDLGKKMGKALDALNNDDMTKEEKNEALNEFANEATEVAADIKDDYNELQQNLSEGHILDAMSNVGDLVEKGKAALGAAWENKGAILKEVSEANTNPNEYAEKLDGVELSKDNQDKIQDRFGVNVDSLGLSGNQEVHKEEKEKELYTQAEKEASKHKEYEDFAKESVDRLIANDPDFGRKLADAMAAEKVDPKHKGKDIYRDVHKASTKLYEKNGLLDDDIAEEAKKQQRSGKLAQDLKGSLREVHERNEEKKKEAEKAREKEKENAKEVANDDEKERVKDKKDNEIDTSKLTQDQKDALKKYEERGNDAEKKLAEMPKDSMENGTPNNEKIQAMTQVVATEYIKKYPDKFGNVDDMNQFVKDFYQNPNVKKAMLRISMEYSGEEIQELVDNGQFGRVLKNALDQNEKKPENAEERKEKRAITEASSKLRPPRFEEDIKKQKEQKKEMEEEQKLHRRSMAQMGMRA